MLPEGQSSLGSAIFTRLLLFWARVKLERPLKRQVTVSNQFQRAEIHSYGPPKVENFSARAKFHLNVQRLCVLVTSEAKSRQTSSVPSTMSSPSHRLHNFATQKNFFFFSPFTRLSFRNYVIEKKSSSDGAASQFSLYAPLRSIGGVRCYAISIATPRTSNQLM